MIAANYNPSVRGDVKNIAGIRGGHLKSIVGILDTFAFQKFCSHLRGSAGNRYMTLELGHAINWPSTI